MSASREKKERKQYDPSENVTASGKKGMSPVLKKVLIAVTALVVIAAVVFFTLFSNGALARCTTAAVVGNHKLSPVMVNYFYADAYSTYAGQMGDLVSYMFDTEKPLSEQIQDEETGKTWADYFMDLGLQRAAETYALYDQAQAEGFTLDEEETTEIESYLDSYDMYAQLSGLSDGNAYLASQFGKGCNKDTFREYMTVTQTASVFSQQKSESMVYTDEQIAAEYAANPDDYDGVTYRSFFLAYSDYETDDEEREEASEEAKAAALKDAEEMKSQAKDEHAYIELCKKYASEESKESFEDPDASLRKDTDKSLCEEEAREWLFDASRKANDVEIFSNDVGCYVMYYLNRVVRDTQCVNVRHILFSVDADADEETKEATHQSASEVLAEYLDGDMTEESFAELAMDHSEDSNAEEGGLYEDVYPGQMVAEFDAWCFDPKRAEGDVEIVETVYGYHIIYFVGQSEKTHLECLVENALHTADYNEWEQSIIGNATYTFDPSAMKYTSKK